MSAPSSSGAPSRASAAAPAAAAPAPRCKASVYFKFSRNRTRNRTFPGSMDKAGRAIILEWARQFRTGSSSFDGGGRLGEASDQRRVLTTAKRCKRAQITRERAFEWFRASQEKYALTYLASDVAWRRVGAADDQVNTYPSPPARVVQFQPHVFVPGERTNYIEITWDNQVQFPEEPEIWGLNFGCTRVPIHALEHGGGAFFNASEIPVGAYMVHNVAFEVRHAPDPAISSLSSSSSSSSPLLQDGAAAPAAATAATRATRASKESSEKGSSSRKRSRSRQSTLVADRGGGGGAAAYFTGNSDSMQSTSLPLLRLSEPGAHPASIAGNFPLHIKRRKINSEDVPTQPYAAADGGASFLDAEQLSTASTAGSSDDEAADDEADKGLQQYWGNVGTFTSQQSYLALRHPPTGTQVRLLRRMRASLGDLLTTGHIASCPEVVSDWSLLRFLRGANNHLVRAVDMFRLHLDIRKKYKWHEIRERVVSSPNFDPLSFTMDDIIHGSFIKDHWRTVPCAGDTDMGDVISIVLVPVSDGWIDALMSQSNGDETRIFSRGREFFDELFVRRQLQLDVLSRRQGKMVCVETVWDFSGGISNSYWKNFARSDYRKFQLEHNRIVGCCPNIQGRVHVMRTSWFMRWSCRCLWWITDALLRRKIVLYTGSDSDAYRQLCDKIGMSGLATIIENISKLNAEGFVSSFTLPKNMANIHAPMGVGSSTSAAASAAGSVLLEETCGQLEPHSRAPLIPHMPFGGVTRVPSEPEPTKEIVPVQCIVRSGDVKLGPGLTHEVMIEVDPDRVSAVRWKFSALPQPVSFSAMFFHMNYDPDEPILKDVNVVPLTRLASGEGLIEIQTKGCLLLRWKHEKASALMFWSSCFSGEIGVNYEVESVPRNHDNFAASAIGLLMLSDGAR